MVSCFLTETKKETKWTKKKKTERACTRSYKTTCCYSCALPSVYTQTMKTKKNLGEDTLDAWSASKALEFSLLLLLFFNYIQKHAWQTPYTLQVHIIHHEHDSCMISYFIEPCSACKRWNIIAVNLHLDDDGDCRWSMVASLFLPTFWLFLC